MEGLKRKLLAGFLSMVLVLSLFLSGSVYAEELDEGPAVSVEADEADLETEESEASEAIEKVLTEEDLDVESAAEEEAPAEEEVPAGEEALPSEEAAAGTEAEQPGDDSTEENTAEDASKDAAAEAGKGEVSVTAETFAAAADGKTVLAFTSDIHNGTSQGYGAEANLGANRLTTWLGNVLPRYDNQIAVMGFCGDMGAASAYNSSFWQYVQTVMNVISDHGLTGIYTTGNHEYMNGSFTAEAYAGVTDKYLLNSQAKEGDNYYIYCLGSTGQTSNGANGYQNQTASLRTYLSSLGSDKPIIILTHFPLHYFSSWRTTSGAADVIDVLNEAVAGDDGTYNTADDRKIVFLWGHNHTEADPRYDHIYAPGTSINTTSASSSAKTMNFYYAAAGCMSDSEYGSSAQVKGKGLVLSIDDATDDLTFVYYDANGNAVASYAEEGSDPYIPDDPVVPLDPPFSEGTDYVVPEGSYYLLSSDGSYMTASAGTSYTNGGSGSQSYNYTGLAGVSDRSDAVRWQFVKTTGGYYIKNGDLYLNGTYASNSSGGYNGTLKVDNNADIWVIVSNGNGGLILKSTNASAGHTTGDKYLSHGNASSTSGTTNVNTFTVRSNNENNTATTIAYVDQNGQTVTPTLSGGGDDPTPDDPTPVDPTPVSGAAYKLVSGITFGKEYLIVSTNSGSGYALSNPGGSSAGANMGAASVAILSGDVDGDGTADAYIETENSALVWTIAASADASGKFDITNGADYLVGYQGNVKIFSSQKYPDRGWNYMGEQLQHSGGNNTYTVYYSSGFTSTYNTTSSKVYLFEKVEKAADPDDREVPEDKYTLKVTADQASAHPGDVITYTITLGPVDELGTMQMRLVIPEGLSYVQNSFTIVSGLTEAMGFDNIGFEESSLVFNGVSVGTDYESDADTVLATFRCRVNDTASGSKTVSLDYLEFASMVTFEVNTDAYTVTSAEVEVTEAPVVTGTVTGNITSFLRSDEQISVILYQGDSAIYSATVTGNNAQYAITGVAAGSYTLQVSKADHTTRSYDVTVAAAATVTQDLKIHPRGDINGDGKITTLDFARANSHVQGKDILTGYEFACADVIGTDGKVTNVDAGRINSHARNVDYLWPVPVE